MPFPYSYYQEFFDGPLHGHSFRGESLFITPAVTSLSSGTEIDVTNLNGGVNIGKSHVHVDTSLSDLIFQGITGSTDGQVLFLYKTSTNNKMTIKHDGATGHKVYMANQQDLVLGAGQFGGAIFICKNDGGILKWYQLDSNGLLANGTEALPSLAFASDPNTGIFRKGADHLAIATDGLERFNIATTYIQSLLAHRLTDGSAALPSLSFSSDPTTGVFKDGQGVGFSSGGISKIKVDNDGVTFNSTPYLRSNSDIQLQTTASGAQRLYTGGLLASNDYADNVNIPTDGIYSKGDVQTAGLFVGTATSAQFADLAERYEADNVYTEGTLVRIGGEKEITETIESLDKDVFGIVSSNPAFRMNDNIEQKDRGMNPFIALAGRVPCRIIGKIKKGQRVVSSSTPGVGKALRSLDQVSAATPFYIVGRALESKDSVGEGLVEVAVGGLI